MIKENSLDIHYNYIDLIEIIWGHWPNWEIVEFESDFLRFFFLACQLVSDILGIIEF